MLNTAYLPFGDVTVELGPFAEHPLEVIDVGDVDVVQIAVGAMLLDSLVDENDQVIGAVGDNGERAGHAVILSCARGITQNRCLLAIHAKDIAAEFGLVEPAELGHVVWHCTAATMALQF